MHVASNSPHEVLPYNILQVQSAHLLLVLLVNLAPASGVLLLPLTCLPPCIAAILSLLLCTRLSTAAVAGKSGLTEELLEVTAALLVTRPEGRICTDGM